MSHTIGTWIDGIETRVLPVDDRGLQYGDGLFETLLMRAGRARFSDAHLARLSNGLARLGIAFDAWDALRADIDRATKLAPALAVLKIIVTRGTGPRRGYSPRGCDRARRIVMLYATPPPPDFVEGVDLRIATMRATSQPVLAGLKHLNRLENVLAAMEPEHDAHFESLLLGRSGELVGGTMSNVFAVHGRAISTPRIDESGVEGIMRAVVLYESARLGFAPEERRVTPDDLMTADEIFITNARLGVVPARRVGEHVLRMRDIAMRLRTHIEALDA
ncbi:MAG: aminodeoxychorismate lyase [Steroidobacteraceae bacterium]|nr:aminodeoxychorismate lyase [Steroidobacteraceae bacterium]